MKICLPPGLGDIHWVTLKLEDFMRKHGATHADAWVWDVGGPRRSAEFVYRMPFLTYKDYAHIGFTDGDYEALCFGRERTYIQGKYGFDFVLAVNGWMEHGLPLETAMDGAAINWGYPINRLDDELAYERQQQERGPWILLYFSEVAQFGSWTRFCNEYRVQLLCKQLTERFPGHRLVFVGLPWDAPFMNRAVSRYVENLAGKTNPSEYFALLRGASGMVGFANGNTILTSHFGVPTVMIWNRERYPNEGFRTNWLRPGAHYLPFEIEHFNEQHIVDALARLMEAKDAAAGNAAAAAEPAPA